MKKKTRTEQGQRNTIITETHYIERKRDWIDWISGVIGSTAFLLIVCACVGICAFITGRELGRYSKERFWSLSNYKFETDGNGWFTVTNPDGNTVRGGPLYVRNWADEDLGAHNSNVRQHHAEPPAILRPCAAPEFPKLEPVHYYTYTFDSVSTNAISTPNAIAIAK